MNVSYTTLKCLLLVCCAALVPAAAGCESCGSDDSAAGAASASAAAAPALRVPIKLRVTPEQMAKAEQLKGTIKQGKFPKAEIKKKANAPLFMYLAASSDDPMVIAASIGAMRVAHTLGKQAKGKPRPAGRNYAAIVAAHLNADAPEVRAAAIRASRVALIGAKPNATVVKRLVTLAKSGAGPGVRVAALQALKSVSSYQKRKPVAGALLAALKGDSVAVQARALELALFKQGRKLHNKRGFAAQARALMASKDPAVRGRAALLAASLEPYHAEVYDQIGAMLEDEHACARTFAILALEQIGSAGAIRRIVGLLDDTASDRHDIKFKDMSGRTISIKVNAQKTTVQDRAVQAIGRLSAKLDEPFKPQKAAKGKRAEARAANAAAAQAWYAKHKAKLPADEAPPQPEQAEPTAKKPAKKPAPSE